jgi:hypothetical protein
MRSPQNGQIGGDVLAGFEIRFDPVQHPAQTVLVPTQTERDPLFQGGDFSKHEEWATL